MNKDKDGKLCELMYCERCKMYMPAFEQKDEHEARHEFEDNRIFKDARDNDPANDEGDFSGASYDEWDGR